MSLRPEDDGERDTPCPIWDPRREHGENGTGETEGRGQDTRQPDGTEAETDSGEQLTLQSFASQEDPGKYINDPIGKARIRGVDAILRRARAHLDKRLSNTALNTAERLQGPQGEALTLSLTHRVELIPLDLIVDDPDFHNVRLSSSPEELDELAQSMNREGLRVPVIAIPTSPQEDCFHLRAGFRRTTAARKLGWKKIPAIILPPDTPLIEEYWTNILENSARSRLTTYETALAAKTMRDQFGVRGTEFATRAGYSSPYIGNLLRCIDNLPPEIIEIWRDRAPIPIDMYVKWAQFTHDEAVKMMLAYCGRNPKTTKEWHPPPEIKERYHPPKLASAKGHARMQKIRIAIEVATSLDDRSRALALAVVDCCSGARDDVPDVYLPGQKIRSNKSASQKKPSTNPSRPCNASPHEEKVIQQDDRSSDSPQTP